MSINHKQYEGQAIIHKDRITLLCTQKSATPKQARTYLKGVLYDYMRPFLVEGKKENALNKAIEDNITQELRLVAVKEAKGARRIVFSVPNIPEAHLDGARG
jgi:hypothetical protein